MSQTSATPEISVIIPAFNAERVLGLQLEALAAQEGAPEFDVDNQSVEAQQKQAGYNADYLALHRGGAGQQEEDGRGQASDEDHSGTPMLPSACRTTLRITVGTACSDSRSTGTQMPSARVQPSPSPAPSRAAAT